MSEYPTLAQAMRILEIIGEQKLSMQEVQRLVEMPGVLATLSQHDGQISPYWMQIQLDYGWSIPWTPVRAYPDLIAERAKKKDWPISAEQIQMLENKLKYLDHGGDFLPIGVEVWLGDLSITTTEMLKWIADGQEEIYQRPDINIMSDSISHQRALERPEEPALIVRKYDLMKHWDKNVEADYDMPDVTAMEDIWPGVNGLSLVALNPVYFVRMNGKTVPYCTIPGLRYGNRADKVIQISKKRLGSGSRGWVIDVKPTQNPYSTLLAYAN